MSYQTEGWHEPYGPQFEDEDDRGYSGKMRESGQASVPLNHGRNVEVYGLPPSPEGLYTRSWSYSMPPDLYADQFDVESEAIYIKPKLCDDHLYNGRPVCFKAEARWSDLAPRYGFWTLKSPLKPQNLMPGTNQRLVGLTVEGLMVKQDAWIVNIGASAHVIVDGGEVWKGEILHSRDSWRTNRWTEDQGFMVDLSGATDLDIGVEQYAGADTGYVALHDGKIVLDGLYDSTDPPEKVTVGLEVLNMETGDPVEEATVRLMTGNRVVASGYTDEMGMVTFQNVDEGSYSVIIRKTGYEAFEQSIDATPPEVGYTFWIAPKPTKPVPWYWYAGAGAIGIAALLAYTKPPTIMEPLRRVPTRVREIPSEARGLWERYR